MQRIATLIFFLQAAIAMLIPEETELLDGYVSFPDTSFDGDYFEARSLSEGPLLNSVRNKRGIGKFTDEKDTYPIPNRKRRNVESEKPKKLSSSQEIVNKAHLDTEKIPTAMKLTKTLDRDSVPAAAALVGKFARSPFEYSKIQHEEDSMALDTSSLSMDVFFHMYISR